MIYLDRSGNRHPEREAKSECMVTGELNELLEEYENLTVAFVFEGNKEDQINCCDLYLFILFLLWVVVD